MLHDGHNHWLTISTVGAPPSNILVYDSMYPSAGQATKRQAASMMMVAEPKLTLHFADVQMQPGGSDCGVFALALQLPSALAIHQASFSLISSPHWCLEKLQFTMFPVKKERRQARKTKNQRGHFTILQMPLIKAAPMIQCSHCKQWCRGKHCITMREDWLPGAKWFCSPAAS